MRDLPVLMQVTFAKSIRLRDVSTRLHDWLGRCRTCPEGSLLMNATGAFLGLLIVLFMIVLLRWRRKMKPQLAQAGLQRMCPHCGLITSRVKSSCLACGKAFTAVVYSTLKK